VLDDATSAIDVTTEDAIHDALQTLMQNRTTIIIAHRLSTISLADRVLLLDEGRLVASGTHAELMANEPRYSEVLARAEEEEQEAAEHSGEGGAHSGEGGEHSGEEPGDGAPAPDEPAGARP
jgi:ATP-binding cassette subfamily B protein